MTQNYYSHMGNNHPKDGSKNKVCTAINMITTGEVTPSYKSRVCGFLDVLPSVAKAHEVHGSNPDYRAPSVPTPIADLHVYEMGDTPHNASNCAWTWNTNGTTVHLHAGYVTGSKWNLQFPLGFPNREIDLLHAVAHLLTPNTAALHGFEFVTILIDLAERFGLASMSKKDSKAAVKSVFIDQKIKTFKRTRPPKTPEQLIAELKKIHSNL